MQIIILLKKNQSFSLATPQMKAMFLCLSNLKNVIQSTPKFS
jgi:hypothetical protein